MFFGLHADKEGRGHPKAVFDRGRNRPTGRAQSQTRLPAELPTEQVVIQSLFAVASIRGKLGEDLPLPQAFQSLQRTAPPAQFRPPDHRQDQAGQFAQYVIIGRRTERTIAPGEPGVRQQDARAQASQRGRRPGDGPRSASDAADLKTRQKRVDPGELNQAQTRFKATGPIPPEVRRILLDPIFQPFKTSASGLVVIQEISSLRESNERIPPVGLPNELDVRFALETVMQFQRRLPGCHVDPSQIVLVPPGRILHLQLQIAKSNPATFQQIAQLAAQGRAQFLRSGFGGRDIREGASRGHRFHVSEAAPRHESIGHLAILPSTVGGQFRRGHRPKTMPVPGNGTHAWTGLPK
ncbi:MAG: hypothetical protein U1G07_09095 [Verrucomicrobiota bacterium]